MSQDKELETTQFRRTRSLNPKSNLIKMDYINLLDRQLEKFLELPELDDTTLIHSAQTLRAGISYITSHLCTLENREKRQIVAMAFVTSVIASLGAQYILDFIFPRKPAPVATK